MDIDLAFVDSISASATVRLDLMLPPWAVQSSTDFGMPELQRAAVFTLLTDGERYPASAYTNRTIRLVAKLHDEGDAAAAVLQKLYRELDRPSNFLRYRAAGLTEPIYFRTHRAGPENVRWDFYERQVTALIPAFPFGLEPPVTIGPFTVSNDPLGVGISLLANGTFESGVAPWTAQNGSVTQSSAQALSGTYSLRLAPTGGLSPVAARSEQVSVTAGLTYQARLSVWSAAGWADVACVIDWIDAGGSLISTSGSGGAALAAGVWEQRVQEATAPVGAVGARVRARMAGTPTASDVLYVDEASIGERGGVGAQYIDLTGVRGDVETPLYVAVPRATALAQPGELTGKRKTLLAVRRRGVPSQAPRALQAEAMSLNPTPGVTDTSASAPSGASGGAARRTSFTSTTSLQARLRADPFPAVASPGVAGEYRVYVRVAATDTTSTFTLGLRWGSADWQVTGPLATMARNSTTWAYVDLGVVQMPPGGVGSDDGMSGVAESVRGIRIDLLAARTGGAGSLDWDVLVFAPADDRMLLAEWPNSADASVVDFVLNPVTETGYARDSGGVRFSTEPIGIEGNVPLISPGVTNRISILRDVGGWQSGTDDTLTSSGVFTGWYYPRYLHARPLSN